MAKAVAAKNTRVIPTKIRSYIADFLALDSPVGQMKKRAADDGEPSELFCTNEGVAQIGKQQSGAHAADDIYEFEC